MMFFCILCNLFFKEMTSKKFQKILIIKILINIKRVGFNLQTKQQNLANL